MKNAPPTPCILHAFTHVDPNTAGGGTIHFENGKWWHMVPYYHLGVLGGGQYVWDDWVHQWQFACSLECPPRWVDVSKVPGHVFSAELPMPVWSFVAQSVGVSPNGHVKSNG